MTGALKPVIPAPLADALRARLGLDLRTAEATVGGFSHLSFTARSGAGQLVVVKAATDPRRRDDLRREAGVLRAWAGAVEPPTWVPTLDGMVDDTADDALDPKSRAETTVPEANRTQLPGRRVAPTRSNGALHTEPLGWTAVVTNHIEGVAGPYLLTARTPHLARHFGLLGRLLGTVHRAVAGPAVLEISAPNLGQRWHEVARALERRLGDAAADERFGLMQLIDAARNALAGRGVTLVHGDAGLHNTIWRTPTAPVLIDWEAAGLGHPLTDVAWAAWTVHFRSLGPACEDALLDGYGRLPLRALGWSHELVVETVRALMASLTLRVFDTSVRAEWLRRAAALDDWPPPS